MSAVSHQAGVAREEREEEVPALLGVLHPHQVGLKLVPGYLGLPPPCPGYVTLGSLQADHFKTSPAQLLSQIAQAGSDINNSLTTADLTF